MPTITISPEFFAKEAARLYDSPSKDFVREFLQNSIDAGATKIELGVEQREINGQLIPVFTCQDNGCGITKQVLEQVFFALGATTKDNDSTSIGGFGRARILQCFAQRGYRIDTLDSMVQGHGAEYYIHDAGYSEGCKFHVHVNPELISFDYLRPACYYMAARYVGGNVEIRVNGQVIEPIEIPGEKVINDNGITAVQDPKDVDCSYVDVYVNNLFTGSVYVGDLSGFTSVFLSGPIAREVLTASRNGFRSTPAASKLISTIRRAHKEVKYTFHGDYCTGTSIKEGLAIPDDYDEKWPTKAQQRAFKKHLFAAFSAHVGFPEKWTISVCSSSLGEYSKIGNLEIFHFSPNLNARQLKAAAYHEAAHRASPTHNTSFAYALTEIIAKV